MIDMNSWIQEFMAALDRQFGQRIWFVGLQGSRSRGEATDSSDIDMVVILDVLSPSDVRAYRTLLDSLPYRELSCGFLAGQDELLHWDAADLFQFYHDTVPIRGSLDVLLPRIDATAVARAIHLGACSIYHGCVHYMVHSQDPQALTALYKAAVFVVQAICFRDTGRYVRRQQDLLTVVNPADQQIIRSYQLLRQGSDADFDVMADALLKWARAHIIS